MVTTAGVRGTGDFAVVATVANVEFDLVTGARFAGAEFVDRLLVSVAGNVVGVDVADGTDALLLKTRGIEEDVDADIIGAVLVDDDDDVVVVVVVVLELLSLLLWLLLLFILILFVLNGLLLLVSVKLILLLDNKLVFGLLVFVFKLLLLLLFILLLVFVQLLLVGAAATVVVIDDDDDDEEDSVVVITAAMVGNTALVVTIAVLSFVWSIGGVVVVLTNNGVADVLMIVVVVIDSTEVGGVVLVVPTRLVVVTAVTVVVVVGGWLGKGYCSPFIIGVFVLGLLYGEFRSGELAPLDNARFIVGFKTTGGDGCGCCMVSTALGIMTAVGMIITGLTGTALIDAQATATGGVTTCVTAIVVATPIPTVPTPIVWRE
jgi:hypothetical protein